MITPKQVSETLNVPASTIRRWASRFEKHLSPRTGKKRTYTVTDLDTFRRIRDLSASGFGLAHIENTLHIVEKPIDKSTDLITLSDFVRSLEYASNRLADFEYKLDQLNEHVKHLEAQLAWYKTPWYQKIGKKPPEPDKP